MYRFLCDKRPNGWMRKRMDARWKEMANKTHGNWIDEEKHTKNGFMISNEMFVTKTQNVLGVRAFNAFIAVSETKTTPPFTNDWWDLAHDFLTITNNGMGKKRHRTHTPDDCMNEKKRKTKRTWIRCETRARSQCEWREQSTVELGSSRVLHGTLDSIDVAARWLSFLIVALSKIFVIRQENRHLLSFRLCHLLRTWSFISSFVFFFFFVLLQFLIFSFRALFLRWTRTTTFYFTWQYWFGASRSLLSSSLLLDVIVTAFVVDCSNIFRKPLTEPLRVGTMFNECHVFILVFFSFALVNEIINTNRMWNEKKGSKYCAHLTKRIVPLS